jgi:hypothetical protein
MNRLSHLQTCEKLNVTGLTLIYETGAAPTFAATIWRLSRYHLRQTRQRIAGFEKQPG